MYTRIDECSAQLFDAICENKFKLAKILIDDGKVDVNIKDFVSRRHYKLKEKLSGLLIIYGSGDSISTHLMIWGRQP